MTINCAICEYNPFHNGHALHMNFLRRGCDASVVIMSGSFTQRGDAAIADKYTRAKWAVAAGADIVLELPAVFACANAEIFAYGAVKILNNISDVNYLCFGTESGTERDFYNIAGILNNEDDTFKGYISEFLKKGITLAEAKYLALEKYSGGDIVGRDDFSAPPNVADILKSPNNILGVEYTKALLKLKSDIKIKILKREGGGYNDENLTGNFSSATAIRKALKHPVIAVQCHPSKILEGNLRCAGGRCALQVVVPYGEIQNNVPPFVFEDLTTPPPDVSRLIMYGLLQKSAEEIRALPDVSEGLENRIKKYAEKYNNYDEFLKRLKTRRYTLSRLKRICVCSLLGITSELTSAALNDNLYFKVLALKEGREDILSHLSKSKSVLIMKNSDKEKLSETAKKVIEIDDFAERMLKV